MRVDLNPCYVLHARSYKESSLILDVLSREYGRLSVVARGARRRRSSHRVLCQPYQKLLLGWSIRGEMGTLSKIEAAARPIELPGRKVLEGFYLNELLVRLLHRFEAHPGLFDVYEITLQRIASWTRAEPAVRLFEKHLLESLGYGLILDHDVDSGKEIEPDCIYSYSASNGPSLRTSADVSAALVSGTTLLALHNETLSDQRSLREAKHLMRYLLGNLLGNRPLASRQLYRSFLHIGVAI